MSRLFSSGMEWADKPKATPIEDINFTPPDRPHKPDCQSKVYEGNNIYIISCTCYPPKIHELGLNSERVEL